MGLGSNECMSPEVVADVGGKVSGKVVAALVIGAGRKSALVVRGVEAQVLATDSSHYISTEFLAQLPSIHGIETIKDRPIRRLEEEPVAGLGVERLMRTPGNVYPEADVVLQDKNSAEAWVQASTERRKNIAGAVGRNGGRFHAAEAKGAMELLRRCRCSE